jgi:predicted Zn-dependent peptidase
MSRSLIARSGRALSLTALLALAAASVMAAGAPADRIVDHPDELKFEKLDYTPPKPGDYRHKLKSGANAYVAQNPEVPTFQLTIHVRTGTLFEPVEKAGVARMTAHLMRNGGVEGMTAAEFDEQLALLAGEISVDIDTSKGTVRLFCLAKDADAALALLEKVLRTPAFDQKALDRYRTDVLSELEQRNASTGAIEAREWQFLMYGDHPSGTRYRRTKASVESITRDDLIAFHRMYFFPGNFIFAASGDLETKEILAKLNDLVADWPDHELSLPSVSDRIPEVKPGVYMIAKEDVNQSRIRVGHIGVKRDIPDEHALLVMNDILGGGGFTSRIMRRVRSDEGLAYSAGSTFGRRRPVLYPGTFFAFFQTKHATAAFGTQLMVTEIERIRSETCDAEVVENAKAGFISSVVNPFSTRNRMVDQFAGDEYTGRPDNYWQKYTKNMEAVTPEAVLEVAKRYLHPDKLVFLVVGDPKAVEAGSDKHPERYSDFGPVTTLPLRDPMTLEVE